MHLYSVRNKNELRNRIEKFVYLHEQFFDYSERKMLADFLYYGNVSGPLTDTLLAQIYEATGLLKKNRSIYYQFTKILKQNFDLDRPIVEVGSGIFPALGSHLEKEQMNLKNGTLTIYDSRLCTDYQMRATLKRETFTEKTIIPSDSLLIGMFPCQATEVMIKKALNEKLEFCIALCGCNHGDYLFGNRSQYHQLLISRIKRQLPETYELDVTYFPKKCIADGCKGFPILIAKEKTKKLQLFGSILKK